MPMLAVAYVGGNIVRFGDVEDGTDRYMTMGEFRAMADRIEAEYRAQSCCPSCGVLTLDGSACADCLRYEESAQGPSYDPDAYKADDALYDEVAKRHDRILAEFLKYVSSR